MGAGISKTMAPRTGLTTVEIPLTRISVNQAKAYYGNLLAAIEGREELLVKPEQAMRVMKVMEAMFESEIINASVKVNI